MSDGRALEQASLHASDYVASSFISPVLVGTVAAGTMDILAAIVVWTLRDVPAIRVLQSIASGLLGRDAFSHGAGAAWLGMLLHYAIMTVIAFIFVVASRRLDFAIRHPLLAGAAYGLLVFLVMTYVVVPLSASPLKPPPPLQVLEGMLIHMICVGLPISLATHRFGRQLLAD